MTPRLIACHFGDRDWTRMAAVLAHTAREHCPGWDVQIEAITPVPHVSALGMPSHVANTQKMEHWFDRAMAAPDGTPVLCIDADTMIVQPIDAVWDRVFDLAYTTKVSRFPFNSGVVFLRMSEPVRDFLAIWMHENRRMLGDQVHHQVWRAKYGGINQASLGYALESKLASGLRLAQLPCVEWNCEDSAWDRANASTRIVHVKSGLRKAALRGRRGATPAIRRLADQWRALDARLRQPEARPA